MAEAGTRPVVLVTGAAGGIGGAVGTRFAAGGWRVAGTDQSWPGGPPDGWVVHEGDVRDPDDCAGAVAAALASFGRLDAVVCAAGVWREGPLETMPLADWDLLVGVNLTGTYLTCRAAIPALRATRGTVVTIASDAGLHANRGAAAYCATKAGVVLLTKTLALDLAPDGVRAVAVCPSDVDTPMLRFQAETYGGGDPDGYRQRLLAAYPGEQRFLQPAEVAEVVWFCCQPEARAITGAAIPVDLGLTAGI